MTNLLTKHSDLILVGLIIVFGVFLAWNIVNSDSVSRLLNRTENVTVSGTNSESGLDVERDLEIVTLLPFDRIRSIEDPLFLGRERADDLYDSDELVLGVEIDGDARAYSVPLLSKHEVVNDVVGGKPIAVTW